MKGTCQCGMIEFSTPTPTFSKLYCCHCMECRRQSSSAYGMSAVFPRFKLPESEFLGVYTRPTSHGGSLKCYFCRNCGSRLMHVSVSDSNSTPSRYVTIKAGCLEGLNKEMVARACHIWTTRAITKIPDGAENYEEEPPEDLPSTDVNDTQSRE